MTQPGQHVRCSVIIVSVLLALVSSAAAQEKESGSIPDTRPLEIKGDIASQLVDGVDRFLLQKISESSATRTRHWQRKFTSTKAYNASIEPNRKRLAHIFGIRDQRIVPVEFTRERVVDVLSNGPGGGYSVYAVRWPVLADPDPKRSIASVYGEGLLLVPHLKPTFAADVVAIPDCDQTPAQIAGLVKGVAPESQFARHLVERNCRVLIPMLISRERSKRNGRANLTNREFVYRTSFELGRHLIGYEVQKVLAGIDWLKQPRDDNQNEQRPVGVIGFGEGGRIALAAAAIDNRVEAVCLSGSFGGSDRLWNEPLDRNVFGLLDQFGNAEILSMLAPRKVLINHTRTERQEFTGDGGGPAVIEAITLSAGNAEVERTRELTRPFIDRGKWKIHETEFTDAFCDSERINWFLDLLTGSQPDVFAHHPIPPGVTLDEKTMQRRAVEELDRHNQLLLRESPFVRREFMKQLRKDSVETYTKSVEHYRDIFRNDVIGHFDDKVLPFNARTRRTWDEEKWTGHEVVLDVFPGVIAYGVLLLPKDLKPGDKRPVVVCQHGLEGRPTDTFRDNHNAYHDFAARLAERGFITFAPQNLYIFKDRFRTLQRKANPLGKTLFSVIVPQHQQIVDWLKTLPGVDPDRIAFYGLSYGGKSAMRIPALVTDYCLSICSADFNEWVRKNASTRHNYSYVWTGEYEIFEWDLGSTFNYAEMAALICPRPFMVERGHFDGVGTDEWVAYEFAKVRHLYAAELKIGDKTEIEWFVGPHTINGKGTFDFLHRHLHWPPEKSSN
jgi:dienelactone hydrolase